MKTKIQSFILLVTFILGFNIYSFGTTQQNGEVRTVPEFSAVKLAISANVYVKQSNNQSLRIVADKDILKLIETSVKDGALTIKWNKRNVRNTKKINIYISMKEISALAISGSGDIKNQGAIETTKLELAISGSGDISLMELKAGDVNAKISGSADIKLAGNALANSLSVAISGSGNINASDFKVNNANVKISGSADCSVYVLEHLNAVVSGSGDIYYYGRPIINGKVSGSGTIKGKEK